MGEVLTKQLQIAVVANHSIDEGKSLSRMAWLNSIISLDNEITRGYKEIGHEENRIKILGRTFEIAPTGFPARVNSYFEPSNQFLVENGEFIINHPFQFVIKMVN